MRTDRERDCAKVGVGSQTIHVACAADARYALPMAVMLRSLGVHVAPGRAIDVYALDDGIAPPRIGSESAHRSDGSWQIGAVAHSGRYDSMQVRFDEDVHNGYCVPAPLVPDGSGGHQLELGLPLACNAATLDEMLLGVRDRPCTQHPSPRRQRRCTGAARSSLLG
jgi:hypothetical protein